MAKKKQKNVGQKKVIPPVSAARQRILCDESIQFLYSKKDPCIHDKTCIKARDIPDEDLQPSTWYDADRPQCPDCALAAYLRVGAKDRKNYRGYAELYKKMKTSPEDLRRMYVDRRMTTSLAHQAIRVEYGADAWQISPEGDRGIVALWHNNYRTLSDGSRDFTGGFHRQFLPGGRRRFSDALDVIELYVYAEYHTEKPKEEAKPAAARGEAKKRGILARILHRIAVFLGISQK